MNKFIKYSLILVLGFLSGQLFCEETQNTKESISRSPIFIEEKSTNMYEVDEFEKIRFNKVFGYRIAQIILLLNEGSEVPFIEVESFMDAFTSDYHLRYAVSDTEFFNYISAGGSPDQHSRQRISYALGRDLCQKILSSNWTYINIGMVRKQCLKTLETNKPLDFEPEYSYKYRNIYRCLLTKELQLALKKNLHK